MLASFLWGEWGGGGGGGKFFFISRVGFIFMWGVSITHPVLASFLCGEFLLHIPCWLHFYVGSSPYTPRVVFTFTQGVSLTLPVVAYIYILIYSTWGMSLLYIYYIYYLGNVSNTSSANFCLILHWGSLSEEFLLHIPASFLSGVFLLHTLRWLHFYAECFSYTSRAGFIFIWGVSFTHPVLASFLSGEFLLHIPCWLYFLFGEFLLHITCWLHFYLWSFSYTSRAGFIVFFFSGAFLLHIPRWLHFYLGCFSYTSCADFVFMWVVSLTHHVLPLTRWSFCYTSHISFIFI